MDIRLELKQSEINPQLDFYVDDAKIYNSKQNFSVWSEEIDDFRTTKNKRDEEFYENN